jgi:hypothetical protein
MTVLAGMTGAAFSYGVNMWMSQSVYRTGDTVIVYWDFRCGPNGGMRLTFVGPYTVTAGGGCYDFVNQGYYVAGVADPGDVGDWVVYGEFTFITDIVPITSQSYYAQTWFRVEGGPPDLTVSGVGVSPRNPHQDDMVSFSAGIANIGGGDANGFRVDVYLDGSLWDSGSASLAAGTSSTFTSDRQYRAEDGSHNVRWVVNSDRSVQESNYGNNEGITSFFVSPRTVTLTEHATVTKTKTQTEKHTLTITTTRILTATRTTDVTVQSTVTAKALTVTRTLTGLITSTAYSPTVTTTVTVAQMTSSPLLWLAFGAFAIIGVMVEPANSTRMRGFCRRFAGLFSLPGLFSWLAKRHVRKALTAICLVSVIVLSFSSQAGQQAVASTVTMTRTVTVTEWTTLTQSLTSTRYITFTATDTSTFRRTKTGFTTTTPTTTVTVDQRSLTTVYAPTTMTVTSTSATSTASIAELTAARCRLYRELKEVWQNPVKTALLDPIMTSLAKDIVKSAILTFTPGKAGFFLRASNDVYESYKLAKTNNQLDPLWARMAEDYAIGISVGGATLSGIDVHYLYGFTILWNMYELCREEAKYRGIIVEGWASIDWWACLGGWACKDEKKANEKLQQQKALVGNLEKLLEWMNERKPYAKTSEYSNLMTATIAFLQEEVSYLRRA